MSTIINDESEQKEARRRERSKGGRKSAEEGKWSPAEELRKGKTVSGQTVMETVWMDQDQKRDGEWRINRTNSRKEWNQLNRIEVKRNINLPSISQIGSISKSSTIQCGRLRSMD